MSTLAEKPGAVRRVLQRVVLPADRDSDVMPLYVDPDRAALDPDKSRLNKAARGKIPPPEPNADIEQDPSAILDRRRYAVRKRHRISFGTYFNAFPASYWRRWTTCKSVVLRVEMTGAGSFCWGPV